MGTSTAGFIRVGGSLRLSHPLHFRSVPARRPPRAQCPGPCSVNNALARPAIDWPPKDYSWDDYVFGGAGRRTLRCLLRAFLRSPGSLHSRFRSERSAPAPARALFLRLPFPLPLAFPGSGNTSLPPGRAPSPLGSSHELSLGSGPGLRERRQEEQAGTPVGLGLRVRLWKGHRQLRGRPWARRPRGNAGLLLLLQRVTVAHTSAERKFGRGCAQTDQQSHSGPPGRALHPRGPTAPAHVFSGLGSGGLVPFPPAPARPALRDSGGTPSLELAGPGAGERYSTQGLPGGATTLRCLLRPKEGPEGGYGCRLVSPHVLCVLSVSARPWGSIICHCCMRRVCVIAV